MKSIKPGRGPSGMAFIGSVFAIFFGIVWTVLAVFMTRGAGFISIVFPLFGLCFVGIGIVQAIYHFKNATGKDRFSSFDITDGSEEGDPSQRWIRGGDPWDNPPPDAEGARFCAWCSAPLDSYPKDIVYCPKCGRKL